MTYSTFEDISDAGLDDALETAESSVDETAALLCLPPR
jgi:hypothetical protein